jgi:hypothetical protein
VSSRLLGPHAVDRPLFGALLVAGWWLARGRGPQAMAAAVWAGAATVAALVGRLAATPLRPVLQRA